MINTCDISLSKSSIHYAHSTFILPLIDVLRGENSIVISVVPACDDVGDGQRSNDDKPDAAHDLDDAAETDGEQGEDRRDQKPPARAMDHDALQNNDIALSKLLLTALLVQQTLLSLLPPLKQDLGHS